MLLSGHYAAATVIGLLLSLVSFLLLTGYQRKVVYHRLAPWLPLTARPRRTSSSKTPPRSISPERKPPGNVPPPVEHKDIFPPWRRDALVPAATSSPFARKNEPPGAFDDSPDRIFRESLIPFTTDYRICASPAATYTPMGISLSEIAALSDFPDYAKLSGVPLPIPYTDFRIETALPRPYRPFRWAYHQTMSLTRLEKDWWLEMESNFVESIRERKELFDKYGTMMLNYLPGSELACKELMEMVLQFQCARYPQYFSLSHSEQRGHVFHNGILKNETVIRDMHPLHVLLENVPEDFAVMLRNPEDGHYYLRAGVLCSSLGWNLSTKLGMQLKEIHQPIPDYKEKMEFSMDRYFAKLPPARPIQRGSWGLEIDKPLFMPPGDPHEAYRGYQMDPAELPLSRIHLRVDWQTLRRLPLSGSIIFNFKALFTPVEDFREEPHIPRLLAHILRNGPQNIMAYKNTWHVEHVVLPALDRWAREQESEGMVEKGWEVSTLEETPFFRGWEEKWRARQGF
ncbi:MAG: hypothetical protein LQ343_003592 [Gyalolechia ehrenbergii]|nr:MAG: hypothetical protein LQ343_003592 [Gyalolechia ehrenbergii]